MSRRGHTPIVKIVLWKDSVCSIDCDFYDYVEGGLGATCTKAWDDLNKAGEQIPSILCPGPGVYKLVRTQPLDDRAFHNITEVKEAHPSFFSAENRKALWSENMRGVYQKPESRETLFITKEAAALTPNWVFKVWAAPWDWAKNIYLLRTYAGFDLEDAREFARKGGVE